MDRSHGLLVYTLMLSASLRFRCQTHRLPRHLRMCRVAHLLTSNHRLRVAHNWLISTHHRNWLISTHHSIAAHHWSVDHHGRVSSNDTHRWIHSHSHRTHHRHIAHLLPGHVQRITRTLLDSHLLGHHTHGILHHLLRLAHLLKLLQGLWCYHCRIHHGGHHCRV